MFVEHKEVGEVPAKLDAASILLLAAADYLEHHGWRQFGWGRRGAPMCISGALLEGCGINDGRNDAMQRLSLAIGGKGESWNDAITWNNAKGRTKNEVVAKLRAVALGG